MKTTKLALVLAVGWGLVVSTVHAAPVAAGVPSNSSACEKVFGKQPSKRNIAGISLSKSDLFYGTLDSTTAQPNKYGDTIPLASGSVKYRYKGQWLNLNLIPEKSSCTDQADDGSETLTLFWQGSQYVKETYSVSSDVSGIRQCYLGVSGPVNDQDTSDFVLLCVSPLPLETEEQAFAFLARKIPTPSDAGYLCATTMRTNKSLYLCYNHLSQLSQQRTLSLDTDHSEELTALEVLLTIKEETPRNRTRQPEN